MWPVAAHLERLCNQSGLDQTERCVLPVPALLLPPLLLITTNHGPERVPGRGAQPVCGAQGRGDRRQAEPVRGADSGQQDLQVQDRVQWVLAASARICLLPSCPRPTSALGPQVLAHAAHAPIALLPPIPAHRCWHMPGECCFGSAPSAACSKPRCMGSNHPRSTRSIQVWNESFAFSNVTDDQSLKIEVGGRGRVRAHRMQCMHACMHSLWGCAPGVGIAVFIQPV